MNFYLNLSPHHYKHFGFTAELTVLQYLQYLQYREATL